MFTPLCNALGFVDGRDPGSINYNRCACVIGQAHRRNREVCPKPPQKSSPEAKNHSGEASAAILFLQHSSNGSQEDYRVCFLASCWPDSPPPYSLHSVIYTCAKEVQGVKH